MIEETQDTDVIKIYSLLLKYGVGLDQESLILIDEEYAQALSFLETHPGPIKIVSRIIYCSSF